MPMTHTELLEILKNGENSGVEFKRDDVPNFKVAKELVAFSNLVGGVLLLGIEEDGTVSGIARDSLEEWIMTLCRDKIRPAIIPFYEVVKDVEPGKDVAVVRVTRGLDVHTLWHDNSNKYYIRVGTESREPTPEELKRLFQQRQALRAELTPVSGAKFTDLDLRRLKDYFIRVRSQPELVPPDDDKAEAAWKTLLTNTEFMDQGGAILVAAILLFGRQPQRFLPQASINAMAYPGTVKDYAARERINIKGPLTGLLAETGTDKPQLVEAGLIEQAVDFIARNTVSTARIVDGARREDRQVYPPEVIREAIVNAVIHRDYLLTGTDIELTIYEDRIEIISPGRLYNGITPERMRTGCRASRSQLIRDTMSDYKYMDNSGLGIPRKIIKGMQAHNGTAPDLIEDGELFMIRLHAKRETQVEKRINEALSKHGAKEYNTPPGAILDLMTEFANEMDLRGVSNAFVAVSSKYPENTTFVASMVPAKITNFIIAHRGVEPSILIKWIAANPDWENNLKGALHDPARFEQVVEDMGREVR